MVRVELLQAVTSGGAHDGRPRGCQRGDVSVPAGERIFFCTSVWDDAAGLKAMAAERVEVAEKLRKASDRPDPRTRAQTAPEVVAARLRAVYDGTAQEAHH